MTHLGRVVGQWNEDPEFSPCLPSFSLGLIPAEFCTTSCSQSWCLTRSNWDDRKGRAVLFSSQLSSHREPIILCSDDPAGFGGEGGRVEHGRARWSSLWQFDFSLSMHSSYLPVRARACWMGRAGPRAPSHHFLPSLCEATVSITLLSFWTQGSPSENSAKCPMHSRHTANVCWMKDVWLNHFVLRVYEIKGLNMFWWLREML